MTEPAWHKSTYSGSNDNCVEVWEKGVPRVLVRDTKDHEAGVLAVAPAAWAAFAGYVADLAH